MTPVIAIRPTVLAERCVGQATKKSPQQLTDPSAKVAP